MDPVFPEAVFSHEYFMRLALKEAQNAFDEHEVPVGCIVVCENKITNKKFIAITKIIK